MSSRKRSKSEGKRLEEALTSCLAFGRHYLPHLYKLESPKMHHEWDELAVNPEETRLNLQAFREGAKSTFWAITYPLWRVSLWNWMLRNQGTPEDDEHIGIFGVDGDHAEARLRQVRREIETNADLKRDFGPFEYGQNWNDQEIILGGAREVIHPTVFAVGVGGAVPGVRMTAGILDDTTHPQHVMSRAMRDKQTAFLEETVVPSMKDQAPIICIHTTFHSDDLPNRLAKDKTWKSRKWPLVIDEERRLVQWPEAYPWRRVEEIKKKPLIYARQYQLRDIGLEERLIPLPDFYPEKLLECRNGIWFAGGELLRVGTGVDPAASERELRLGSRTAIVTQGLVSDGTKYTLDYKELGGDPTEVFAAIDRTWRDFRPLEIYIEAVAFSAIYARMFRKMSAIPVKEAEARGDKVARITGVLNPQMHHKEGQAAKLRHLDNDNQRPLVQQLVDFPGDRLDGPDAQAIITAKQDSSPVFLAGTRKKSGLISNVRAAAKGGGYIRSNWED